MGLLQDTVRDARRALPATITVRRSAQDASPAEIDDTPEPADEGALTVYRLQKEGGSPPLMASPEGPRPSREAGGPAGRPEGIAVLTRGAVRPDRKVIDRVETRQDRLLEKQSDDSGVPASRVPAAPVAALMEAGPVSAGSNPASADVGNVPVDASPVPASAVAPAGHGEAGPLVDPSEGHRERDSGNKPSTGWRRENGQDAPSEDLSWWRAATAPGPVAGLAKDAFGQPPRFARGAPAVSNTGTQVDAQAATPAGPATGAPAGSAAVEQVRSRVAGRAVADPRPAGPGALGPGSAAGLRDSAAANAGAPPVAGQAQRLSIGRIEVVVLAPAPQPPSSPQSDAAAFLSKHYLRRL